MPLPEYVIGADELSQTKLEFTPLAVNVPLLVTAVPKNRSVVFPMLNVVPELVVMFSVELLKFTSVVP